MTTFNDIPNMMDRVLDALERSERQVAELSRKVDALSTTLREHGIEDLISGIWRPTDYIMMSDKRLYIGPNAPFKSPYAVRVSRQYGCPWHASAGQRSYRILARDLGEWLTDRH